MKQKTQANKKNFKNVQNGIMILSSLCSTNSLGFLSRLQTAGEAENEHANHKQFTWCYKGK